MPKRKKAKPKSVNREGRLRSARKWLRSGNRSHKSLIKAYMKRYAVSETVAWEELAMLGCYDQLCIEAYEKDGTDWEYRYEPLSGDIYVVPEGTEDHELYMIHPII